MYMKMSISARDNVGAQQMFLLPSKQASLAQVTKTCLQCRRPEFSLWIEMMPWRREWLPTPVFMPGEFHGQEAGGLRSMGWQRVRHD